MSTETKEERRIRRVRQFITAHIFNYLRTKHKILGPMLIHYMEFARRAVPYILKDDEESVVELAEEYKFYGCDWDILSDVYDEIRRVLKKTVKKK